VLHTGTKETALALRRAAHLAGPLGARLTIVAMLAVPYPLALEEPPVAAGFLERSLLALALGVEADATVQIFLCRDPREALRKVLPPASTVVIGGRSPRWWLSRPRRLARALRRDGHTVFLIDPAPL
jgi:hypothetical protein